MATALKGIPRKGIDSTGGVNYFLIVDYNLVKVSVADLVATITLADDTAIDASNNPFKIYYPEAETGNITAPFTVTGATGQGASEETGTLIFSRLSTDNKLELQSLCVSRVLIVEVDFNGDNSVSGVQSGALCSAEQTSGTVGGDLNGLTLTTRAPGGDFMPSVSDEQLKIISVPKA